MQSGKSDLALKDEIEINSRDGDGERPTPKKDSVREGLKLVKIKKPKTPKKEKGGPSRFLGEGISFKAKLIGVEEIDEARGDKLCQETLMRLKQVVKTSGTHKQRIALTISLSGVKLKEEKTGVVLYHHPVHHISFISQDVGDDRAFGYICSPTPISFHFVAIKTEKAASQVVITLRDLFQTVLDMKKQQKIQREEAKSNSIDSDYDRSTTSDEHVPLPTGTTPEPKIENTTASDSNNDVSEPLYEDVSKYQEDKRNAARVAQVNDLLTGDLLDLNFDLNVEQLQQSIAQMNFSLSAVSPSVSTILTLPDQPNENETTSSVASPEPGASSSSQQHLDTVDTVVPPYVDRYAVFEEIDNVPSIFENPTIIEHTLFQQHHPASPVPSDFFKATFDEDEIEEHNQPPPLPPPCLPPRNKTIGIFAELDPLGKNRPFVDKKNFFHEIKNPPKKVLKDLLGNSVDSNSPPTNPSSVSYSYEPSYGPPPTPPVHYPSTVTLPRQSFDPAIPLYSNPFINQSALPPGSSPPAPRVPPRLPSSMLDQQQQPSVFFSERPLNPFYSDTLPPATPPPILISSRSSDPMFAVLASPPSPPSSHSQRKCVTPTPPLPKRKPENPATAALSHSSRPSLRHQSSLASPPIPIPIRHSNTMIKGRSSSISSDSPILDRRVAFIIGSGGRVSPANWDNFDDPVDITTSPKLPRPHNARKQSIESHFGVDPFSTGKPDPFATLPANITRTTCPFETEAFGKDVNAENDDPFMAEPEFKAPELKSNTIDSSKSIPEFSESESGSMSTVLSHSASQPSSTNSLSNRFYHTQPLRITLPPLNVKKPVLSSTEKAVLNPLDKPTLVSSSMKVEKTNVIAIETPVQIAIEKSIIVKTKQEPVAFEKPVESFLNDAFDEDRSENVSPIFKSPVIEQTDYEASSSSSPKTWTAFNESPTIETASPAKSASPVNSTSPVKLTSSPAESQISSSTEINVAKAWTAFEESPIGDQSPIYAVIKKANNKLDSNGFSEDDKFTTLKDISDVVVIESEQLSTQNSNEFKDAFTISTTSSSSEIKTTITSSISNENEHFIINNKEKPVFQNGFEGSKPSFNKLSRQTTLDSTFTSSGSFDSSISTTSNSRSFKRINRQATVDSSNSSSTSLPGLNSVKANLTNDVTKSTKSNNKASVSNESATNQTKKLSPIKSPMSPEENSIFKKKQDPFADDFFMSLAKK